MRPLAAFGLTSLLLAACGGADPSQIGVDELFRVRDGQFVRAPLPGHLPKSGTNPTPAAPDGGLAGPPRITARQSKNNVVTQGQAGASFSGRATLDSVSVAVALKGVSEGYWVVPMGTLDTPTNELTWSVTADFDRDLKPGSYTMLFTVLDDQRVAGAQSALTLCVDGRVPDNLKVCDKTQPLPKAVISLIWDANVDLDLQVVAPGNQWIDAKTPVTAPADAGMLPEDAGKIDRDSNAACAIDGINTENLVWENEAPSGLYRIYANLFDACKQPAVRFRVEVYTAETDGKGNEHFRQQLAQGGELLDISANGGSARGLFVAEYKFE